MGPEEDGWQCAKLGGDPSSTGGGRGAGDRLLGEMDRVRGSSGAIHPARIEVEVCEDASPGGSGGSEGRAMGPSADPGLTRLLERVA